MNILSNGFFENDLINEYCSGIFSDELDKFGYMNQVSSGWKLNNPTQRLFGKVRTITIETLETPDERIKTGLNFLANLSKGEVLLVKGSYTFAYYGELMSRLSQEIGLNGAVIDGLTRDTFYTQTIDFPIFARGYSPVDIKGRGRVDKTDVEIEIDGIKIKSGDYIFGDSDALVFIPQEVFPDLFPKINNAARNDGNIKKMIKEGKSISEILTVTNGF